LLRNLHQPGNERRFSGFPDASAHAAECAQALPGAAGRTDGRRQGLNVHRPPSMKSAHFPALAGSLAMVNVPSPIFCPFDISAKVPSIVFPLSGPVMTACRRVSPSLKVAVPENTFFW